jgi:hypothetical protein
MVHQNTDGKIGNQQQIVFHIGSQTNVFSHTNFLHEFGEMGGGGRLYFQNMGSRLNVFDDFLNVGTGGHETNIVLVFVNVIAKHLLVLLIHHIQIVNDDNLLFPENGTVGLAKRFHFIAEKMNALFFQIVDEQNVVLGESVGFGHAIIQPYDGIEQGSFPRI